MKKIILLLVLVLGLVSCKKDIQAQDGLEANKNEGRKMQEAELNALADGLYALISTTRGDILVQLFYGASPLTVINFIGLAEGTLDKVNRKGPYYDGLTFHRVISDFMIQGGDPSGDGTGGPGYSFADEITDSLQFDQPGLLAMANAGPNTNGSQFFITHVPTPHLNGKHTIFGKVVSADDQAVVNSIKQGDRIESIRIIRRGEKTQAFKATQAEFDAIDLANKAEDIAQEEAVTKEMIAIINARFPQAKVSELGVYYVIEKAGSGDFPTKGQVLKMHYDGRLLDNGMIFDNSYERGEPLEVPAGIGHVIKGWDEMMMQMQVGEKRVVILPSALGYGPRGIPGVIPPHAWLQFTMERME